MEYRPLYTEYIRAIPCERYLRWSSNGTHLLFKRERELAVFEICPFGLPGGSLKKFIRFEFIWFGIYLAYNSVDLVGPFHYFDFNFYGSLSDRPIKGQPIKDRTGWYNIDVHLRPPSIKSFDLKPGHTCCTFRKWLASARVFGGVHR